MSKGYQGWANYETWCVSLWVDNEEGTHNYWRTATSEALAAARETPEPFTDETIAETVARQAIWNLAARLKDEISSVDESSLPGLYRDLLHAALDSVDWYEIAKTWVDEELLTGDQ